MLFESLDFLYVPAPNVEESIRCYTNILMVSCCGNTCYGVWVACIKLSNKEPHILLADHIEKKDLMLIYRVNHLDKAFSDLKSRGWIEDKNLEIPNGPCYTFHHPAGNHIAIYENKRPNVMDDFKGRIDDERI